jgi:polyphosphate glucokinase
VRLANDADVQGLGVATGRGLELVVTLGTGFGSVVFFNGARLHLELGHHPFRKGRTYEEELGHRALIKKGKKRWNRYLREAIEDLKRTFNYDRLYIGGGNAAKIARKLDPDVKIISNDEGLLGGIKLWRDADSSTIARRREVKAEETGPSSAPSAPTNGAGRTMRTNSRVRT